MRRSWWSGRLRGCSAHSHDPWTYGARHQDSVIVAWNIIIASHDKIVLLSTYQHPFSHHTNNTNSPNCRRRNYTQLYPPNPAYTTVPSPPRLAKILTTTTPTLTHMQMHSCPSRPPFCEPKNVLHTNRVTSHPKYSPHPSIRPPIHTKHLPSAYFLAHRY